MNTSITNNTKNISSSRTNEPTDYMSASRGSKITQNVTNKFKRNYPVGNISRLTGLTAALPSDKETVAARRANKRMVLASKAKITDLENKISALTARITQVESQLS